MNFQKVLLAGHLTATPELKHSQDGNAFLNFDIAVNESCTPKGGEWVKSVTFAPVICFGKVAENCAKYLQKGSGVFVEGKLYNSEWETAGGEKRQRLQVKAMMVQFLTKPKEESNQAPKPEAAPAAKAKWEKDDNIPF